MWLLTGLIRFAWHFCFCHSFQPCDYCHSVIVSACLLPPDILPRANGCVVPGNQPCYSAISAPSGTYGTCVSLSASPPLSSFPDTHAALVYLRVSSCNTRYNQAWHTSPLTQRQCVSSEPGVITTVDPLLTHDCLSHLWWMELVTQKKTNRTYSSSPLYHAIYLRTTNSHTAVMLLMCFRNPSEAIHRFHEEVWTKEEKMGILKALLLMGGGFHAVCLSPVSSIWAVRDTTASGIHPLACHSQKAFSSHTKERRASV